MTVATNSTTSVYFHGMTDQDIRNGIKAKGPEIIKRMFPGTRIGEEHAANLRSSLESVGALFEVAKHPMMVIHDEKGLDNPEAPISGTNAIVATVRTDTNGTLGFVGPDYGVVQTMEAMEALDILSGRGDIEIMSVRQISGTNCAEGGRIQVVALLGQSVFPSIDGAPNTLGHFAIFEATHDGSACTTATVFTLRLECFNGMTSRKVVTVHKLRHTSKAGQRVGLLTENVLGSLLGDVEAELAIFRHLTHKRITALEFENFAKALTGADKLTETSSDAIKTRRTNEIKELTEYFQGGNEGAGPTAWGAYQSATRWIEGQREKLTDAAKNAGKFDSNVGGTNQGKVAKALTLCQKM